MAQPINIQIERSLTNTPTSLLYGEPAWDDTNEHLYVGNSTGTPVLINKSTNLTIGTVSITNVPILSSTGIGIATLPQATGTLAGILTATNQTIGGVKTFQNNILLNPAITIDGVDPGSPKNSIEINTNQYQLVGDVLNPGNSFLYGTNSTGVKGWYNQSTINHNTLTNYVANQHIDHSTINLNAGAGISSTGLGNLTASRTINLSNTGVIPNTYGSANQVATFTVDVTGRLTAASNININHNTLTNYLADEHIAHSNIILTAGNGLTGGGSIAASRTFNVVGVNSIVANADDIQLVNDSNAPGNNYYYGTNNSGVKGWLPQPSTADLSTVRLSRTTSLNPIPTAWVDFDWTTKHVENNTAIIEYTGTPTDEIQIKEAGLYLVSWAIAADDEIDVRLTNNGVVIPGSFFSAGDKTDATSVIVSNTKTIAVNLSVGILVLQVQATTTAEFTITDSASISVTRLSGVKGAAGSTGPQGPAGTNGTNGLAGPPGFGVYAWADVEGTTGTINNGLGLTVIRNSVGTYTYTFNQALPNGAYAVSVQLYDAGATDFNSFVNSRTTTSFVVTTGLGDNGGSADVLTDANHTVIVIGPGAGAPSGSNLINLRSVNTPITNTPHGTINFGPNFTVTDGGNGIANITIPTSIISPQGYIESNGGSDNAVNYNVVGSIRYAPNGPSFSNTTNFVWDPIDKQWDVNFTGRVKLSINILFTSTGNNNSLFVNFVRQRGANYTSTRIGISDIRNTGGINTDEVSGFLYFECLPGDNFHADIGRFGTNTTAANISSISTFIIERVS